MHLIISHIGITKFSLLCLRIIVFTDSLNMFLSSTTIRMYSLTVILVFSGICFIPSLATGDVWNSVIMVREGESITLSCFDSPPASSVMLTWKVRSVGGNRWSDLFSKVSPDSRRVHISMVFEGRTFEITTNGSLIFKAATPELYNCLIEGGDKKQQQKTVLLTLVKITVTPTPPVMLDRTLRLTALVSPPSVDIQGTWVSPSGKELYTEITRATGSLLSKLPIITSIDSGVYTCRISVHGNSGTYVSEHSVIVTVNEEVFAFKDMTLETPRSLAALSYSSVTLSCPPVLGDYVMLYRKRHDSKMEHLFQFDRWRRSYTNKSMPHLHLIDPASLAAAGNFSFLLIPALNDGGSYLCEVFLDDKAYSQSSTLSVLHGETKSSSSSLELICKYSERSQVEFIKWSHVKNPSRHLQLNAVLGSSTISVPYPVTPETAGEYACTLTLENGNSVKYIYYVQMSSTASVSPYYTRDSAGTTFSPSSALPPADSVSTSSHVTILSSLLFLIPIIAVAVGVLLWRQGCCITIRNVEQSLSYHSGEVENIYENPDDLRQTSPQGAVYMALKPTGEMDVYKELERSNQCCS
ncbi:g6f-like isoform X2 [Misgurnus anguillicaudatus]|uniref:g6f-like isoform X2 n=1 Tax=Misgurnus anguillicaudatus TaxID=75329 RepID=UPI003CCF0E3C